MKLTGKGYRLAERGCVTCCADETKENIRAHGGHHQKSSSGPRGVLKYIFLGGEIVGING